MKTKIHHQPIVGVLKTGLTTSLALVVAKVIPDPDLNPYPDLDPDLDPDPNTNTNLLRQKGTRGSFTPFEV